MKRLITLLAALSIVVACADEKKAEKSASEAPAPEAPEPVGATPKGYESRTSGASSAQLGCKAHPISITCSTSALPRG